MVVRGRRDLGLRREATEGLLGLGGGGNGWGGWRKKMKSVKVRDLGYVAA